MTVRWPSTGLSWVDEIIAGLLLAGTSAMFAVLIERAPWLLLLAGLVASAASVVYELAIDSNGWSWKDVGQREVGIIGGVLAMFVLTLL